MNELAALFHSVPPRAPLIRIPQMGQFSFGDRQLKWVNFQPALTWSQPAADAARAIAANDLSPSVRAAAQLNNARSDSGFRQA